MAYMSMLTVLSGLRSSWASPADKVPSAASFSDWRSRSRVSISSRCSLAFSMAMADWLASRVSSRRSSSSKQRGSPVYTLRTPMIVVLVRSGIDTSVHSPSRRATSETR